MDKEKPKEVYTVLFLSMVGGSELVGEGFNTYEEAKAFVEKEKPNLFRSERNYAAYRIERWDLLEENKWV